MRFLDRNYVIGEFLERVQSFLRKGCFIPESSQPKCQFKVVLEHLVHTHRHHNHSNSKCSSFSLIKLRVMYRPGM